MAINPPTPSGSFAARVATHLALAGELACDDSVTCTRALARALCAQLEDLCVAAAVKARHRVALVMRNTPAHAGLALAVFASDRCLVVVNPFQSADHLAADLARLDVALLLGSIDDLASPAVRAFMQEQGVPGVVLDGVSLRAIAAPSAAAGNIARGAAGDQVFDLSTSGTTGLPKRSAFTGDVVLAAAANMAAMFDEGEDGSVAHDARAPILVPYPMTNMSGLSFLLYAATSGRRLYLLERFTVDTWMAALRRVSQRVVYLPPVAIRMLLDAGIERSAFAGLVLVRTGAAPLEDEVRAQFEAATGVPILSHYGASEFCGTVASFALADYRTQGVDRRGSIGRARVGNLLRVVDADGVPLPAGMIGLLQVQSDRFGNAWMATTDLASIDTDGYIFLHGRADGAINRGGFKIVPEVVVAALRQHPDVVDVSVTGLPDARLGEVPVAAVVLRAGAQLDGAALREFARGSLLAYQVPRHIAIVAALPRNASYKVDRGAVRALFAGLEVRAAGRVDPEHSGDQPS